jgi:hypothetical protein
VPGMGGIYFEEILSTRKGGSDGEGNKVIYA